MKFVVGFLFVFCWGVFWVCLVGWLVHFFFYIYIKLMALMRASVNTDKIIIGRSDSVSYCPGDKGAGL